MKRYWTSFIQLCLAGFLARLGYQMGRSPVLPRFAQDLGASPELIGFIVGASTITGVFFKLPAGVLSDMFGRRKMMIAGLCFFAFTPFFYFLIHHPHQLLIIRFIHGFSTSIFSPVASAYVADLFQKDRGERLGWFAAANEFGSTVGPLFGGIILYVSSNFQVTYAVVAFLGIWPLIFLLLGSNIGKEHKSPQTKRSARQFIKGVKEIVLHPPILIASAMEACLFLGIGALLGFLPLYAREHGINEAQVGILLGIQLVIAMAGKPLTGRLSDRLGRKPMIVSGLILCALILPCITLVKSFWVLLTLCFFFGWGMAVVTPSTTALVADLCRNGHYGSAMGVFGSIWDIGEAAGPIFAGALIGSLGYFPAFGIVAGIMLLGAALFGIFVLDPGHKKSTVHSQQTTVE
jgi:MFS family permease